MASPSPSRPHTTHGHLHNIVGNRDSPKLYSCFVRPPSLLKHCLALMVSSPTPLPGASS